MTYRITGLDPAPFRHLYGLSDAELAAHGVVRHVAEAGSGFPDRIELRDVDPGETVLLVNYIHQPADTPYRASHAILVREGAQTPTDVTDELPEALRRRALSLRAFDDGGQMVDAALSPGTEAEAAIGRLLANEGVAYIHAHYATRGCYAARIDRA